MPRGVRPRPCTRRHSRLCLRKHVMGTDAVLDVLEGLRLLEWVYQCHDLDQQLGPEKGEETHAKTMFAVQGSGFSVHQRVQGSGFRIHQRVQGLGIRDSGLVATVPDQDSLFKHITLPDLTHFTHSIALFLTHPPSSTPTSTLTLPSLPPQLTLQVIGTVNGVAQTCASLASAMAPAFAGNVFSYSLQVFPYKLSRSPLNHDRNSAHGAAIQSSMQPFSHSLFRIVPSHRLRETIKY